MLLNLINDLLDLAKKEKERAKKETLKTNKNKLLFVCMGLTFEVGSENEINNHRIRTIFINNMNQKIMVEVVTINKTWVDTIRVGLTLKSRTRVTLSGATAWSHPLRTWKRL